ncbi:MAG: tRNA ((1)-)-methyltransferase [Pseudomonadota bacterium]|jgi:tRNA (guanine37-N1)-methyltransferase
MEIGVITLFPEMLAALQVGGIPARAINRGLLTLSLWNPRDFSDNKHRRVDERPFGGGPGMVMQVPPLRNAINTAKNALPTAKVWYLSPQGKQLNQALVQDFATQAALILVCGRYEGIDERLIEHDIDAELSIGDYVLSGGEPAAMVVIDAVARQLPDALGDAQSVCEDSFYNGLLDHPHYTRPEIYENQCVPTVLLNGNHAEIRRWRLKQALGRTWLKRPDLLEKRDLTREQRILLTEFIEQFQQGTEHEYHSTT